MRTDQDKSQGNAKVKSMLQQATVKFIIFRDLCDVTCSQSWERTFRNAKVDNKPY